MGLGEGRLFHIIVFSRCVCKINSGKFATYLYVMSVPIREILASAKQILSIPGREREREIEKLNDAESLGDRCLATDED